MKVIRPQRLLHEPTYDNTHNREIEKTTFAKLYYQMVRRLYWRTGTWPNWDDLPNAVQKRWTEEVLHNTQNLVNNELERFRSLPASKKLRPLPPEVPDTPPPANEGRYDVKVPAWQVPALVLVAILMFIASCAIMMSANADYYHR